MAVFHLNKSSAAGNSKRLYTPDVDASLWLPSKCRWVRNSGFYLSCRGGL